MPYLPFSGTDRKSDLYPACRDFVGNEKVSVIDFVRTKICIRTTQGYTFDLQFRRHQMKRKETKKADNGKKAETETEMESVIKLLKKHELQTDVLKKIIKSNKFTDNKSF